MPKIKALPEHLTNQIAAGEVVERPASVIKELVENSLDAGAKKITIELKDGGDAFLRVTDDGCGMDREDAVMAFERHATSKIFTADDLFKIQTLGFRGEAIASITAVAQVILRTKKKGDLEGTLVMAEGGNIKKIKTAGAPEGTQIEVKNLFFNTPARKKYLKNTATEYGHILNTVTGLALAFPEVAFKLLHNGKAVFDLPPTDDHLNRIQALLGRDIADELVPVFYGHAQIRLTGFVGKPAIARSSRSSQYFFVNRREVKSHVLSYAVKQSFYSLLPKEKYPIFLLFFEIDPAIVDVNVHPRKLEVRFADEKSIFKIVLHACKAALEKHILAPKIAGAATSAAGAATSAAGAVTSAAGAATSAAGAATSAAGAVTSAAGAATSAAGAVTSAAGAVINYELARQHQMPLKLEDRALSSSTFSPSASANETVATHVGVAEALDFTAKMQHDFLQREHAEEIVPLTQLANSYILCQQGQKLLIVDQHAAHERIRYTEIIKQSESQRQSVQRLLVALQVELSYREVEILKENLEILKNLGFEIEAFGGNTFSIYAVPSFLTKDDPGKALIGLIDDLQNHATKGDFQQRKERTLTYMACRAAVKFGDPMSLQEQQALLQALQSLALPYTCPHGRPTMITISFEELKKRFGRDYRM